MGKISGARIHITGIVQGVGFRPFVYGLAKRLTLTGWVRNTSAGVDIEVDGSPEALNSFKQALMNEAPPLARIDEMEVQERQPDGFMSFEIIHSEAISGAFQPISPDVSICPDCLRELFDPRDRRYRYPFINCTNCGPRFTIIADIPYDRLKTTMADFPLCPECAAEYSDPLDRRFHAQPVACPICGPHVWLEVNPETGNQIHTFEKDAAIIETQRLLSDGKIVAIKGLGGFHLACDAANPQAVAEMRKRKLRVDKPFALMMPDITTVKSHCYVNSEEQALLESRERPIVILRRRPDSIIAREVAPNQDTIGVMLPYTPLHYLLFANNDVKPGIETETGSINLKPMVLVMTSGNISEEPIASENETARLRLAGLADAFLMHNRPIRTRCDDSVVRVLSSGNSDKESGKNLQISVFNRGGFIIPVRRSRGYAPYPVHLSWESIPLLAAGAELKNTFCLVRDRYAFLSHHIGDLENYETLQSFEDGVIHFERMFRVQPEAIAYDLHPNYLATRYALERAEQQSIPAVGVQHHHAHIAACMAEHGLQGDRPVIGVSFDGTGYGDDGAVWGGEFLLANYSDYQRVAHLAYTPLPGGDAAVRKPARIALAYLWQFGLEWVPGLAPVNSLNEEERAILHAQLERHINTPYTSSMGRLFDGVASLVGVRQTINYEAQAAIELEALADPGEEKAYGFDLQIRSEPARTQSSISSPDRHVEIVDPTPLFRSILEDMRAGVPVPSISARFHNAVALMVSQVCRDLQDRFGISEIALSGGVWQNVTLLNKTIRQLSQDHFTVYLHHTVPTNDGGLSLGQAVIAGHRLS
jgi:hydrogenase maturation protein HypF